MGFDHGWQTLGRNFFLFFSNLVVPCRHIGGNCERLDTFVGKEPPHRRRTVKYKVDQLKFDCHSLSSVVDNIHMRMTNKWRAIAEREELLTQRYFKFMKTVVL